MASKAASKYLKNVIKRRKSVMAGESGGVAYRKWRRKKNVAAVAWHEISAWRSQPSAMAEKAYRGVMKASYAKETKHQRRNGEMKIMKNNHQAKRTGEACINW